MRRHAQHDPFIQIAELHNRLLAAARHPDLFPDAEAACIRDMAERYGVEDPPMLPTPWEAAFLDPEEAARMAAITYTLVLHDIAWGAAGRTRETGS